MADHLVPVLQGLMVENDAERDAAEKQLDMFLENHPEQTALAFLEVMSGTFPLELQQLSCVLFRRYALHLIEPHKAFWSRCSAECRATIQQQLIALLSRADLTSMFRSKISDCIASVVKAMSVEIAQSDEVEITELPSVQEYWPDLLTNLFQLVQSQTAELIENAVMVFVAIPGLFGRDLEKHLETIHQLIRMCFAHNSLDVKIVGAEAFAAFMPLVPKKHWASFCELIPPTLELASELVQHNRGDEAQMVLTAFVEMAETSPKMMRARLTEVVGLMAQIANFEEGDDDCRKLALEVITTLCEQAPGMMRKVDGLAMQIVPICLKFMMTFDDDESWTTEDQLADDDDSDLAATGEFALDRLSTALKGRTFLPAAFALLPNMLVSEDWHQRYVGALSIAAIGEGSHKMMNEHLPSIVERVFPLAVDPVVRVRYAAAAAIGQMSIDFAAPSGKEFATGFQARFHEQAIPTLLRSIRESHGHPRVMAHCITALINFCNNFKRQLLLPYINEMMQLLGDLLSLQSLVVQESTVTALATIADTANKYFKEYYQSFTPALKNIIQHAQQAEHATLRAKTFECFTLMGLAVGKDMFLNDALELINLFKGMKDMGMQSEDPNIGFMLTSWARIAEVLKDDFVPFLPLVLPPLLRSAKLKAEMCQMDDEETYADLPNEGEGWEVLDVAEARIGIKTTTLEEKRVALEMLCNYVKHLRGHMAPFVAELSFITDLFRFIFEDGVRVFAANLVPFCLLAYTENPAYGIPAAQALWQSTYQKLCEAANREPDPETLSFQLVALRDSVHTLKADGLSPEVMGELTKVIIECMRNFEDEALDRYKHQQQDEDFDEHAATDLSEDVEMQYEVVQETGHLIHALFQHGGNNFCPFFEEIAPYFLALLQPGRHIKDLLWGLCVFDDVIEFAPEYSAKFAPNFAELMVANLTSHDAELRQACIYGVGQMAEKAPQIYGDVCRSAMPHIQQLITAEGSRSLQQAAATENAITTLVRMARAGLGATEAEMLPMLLSWLPLTEDDVEISYVMTYLLDLIEAGNPLLVEPNSLLKVGMAIAKVINTEELPTKEYPIGERCLKFLQQLMADANIQSQLKPYIESDQEMMERVSDAFQGH